MGEFLIGAAIGCSLALVFAGFSLSRADNIMCAGNAVVVEKEDTIRTFSCTVELKAKEKK